METLNCPVCGDPYTQGDLICFTCGANLARAGARRQQPAQPARPPVPQPEHPEQPAPQESWTPQHPPQQQPQHPQPQQQPPVQEGWPPHPQPPHPQPPRPEQPAPQEAWAPHQPQQPAVQEPWQRQPPTPEPWAPAQPTAPAPHPGEHRAPHQPPMPPQGRPPLPPPPARREETLIPPEEERGRRPPAPDSTAFMCPHCEAVLSNPAAAQCDTCLRPLRQQAPALRLVFPTGEIKVSVGQHVVLGRDVGQSPVATTFTQYDNVSRRHSTVWLDPSGTAWVRDEGSTNGTFVNGERLPPRVEAPLSDGDSLRLAADVTGTVHVS